MITNHTQGSDDVVCSTMVYDNISNGFIRYNRDIMISFVVEVSTGFIDKLDCQLNGREVVLHGKEVIFREFFLTSEQAYSLFRQLESSLGKEKIRDYKINYLLS